MNKQQRVLAILLSMTVINWAVPAAFANPLGLPLIAEEDFEDGAENWQPSDPKAWRVDVSDGQRVYNQHAKSDYQPPQTSPINVCTLKNIVVTDFVLTARVRSTIPDYGHRDVCLFFGYQDSSHFYYAHLGKKTDDHANQIFLVGGAPRIKISERTTEGTPWDDAWHQLMVVRRLDPPTIEVYFDDMKTPVMTATNDRFMQGRIGIGSFDDTAEWDDLRLFGTRAKQK